jgi:Ca2+-binding RTX toxin-like protein
LLSFTLPEVIQAYDNGVSAIGTAANAAAIIDQVLGVNKLPLADQSLDQALGLTPDFLQPFQVILNQASTDWTNTIKPELISAGFSIPVPFNNGTLDSNNNLLEVTWTKTFSPSDPIQILGQTGLSYLDGNGSELSGDLAVTGSVTVTVSFGVDVNSKNELNFFVVPANNVVQATLSGSTAADGLSGTLVIGDLSNVTATASGELNFTGTLGLQATAADPDGKLRVSDLTTNLSNAVTGGVNGTATIDVSEFDAELFGLPDITWSGDISKSIQNNVLEPETDSLNAPSASSLLSSLGSSFFSLGDGIPVLGSLANTLNKPLPLINESIAQLTSLDNFLPTLPSLPSDFDSLSGSSSWAGGTLTVNVTPATIEDFIEGDDVSLISWESSGDVSLVDTEKAVPIFSLGIPDVASLDIDATFGFHASLHYDIGFGLDGGGFYALTGTPADPSVGISFGASAGVQGQLEVLGFPLAEAGGDIGLSVTPYVTLTAAPKSVDPNSDPNKVYLSDLALFGRDPLSDIVDDVSAGISGDFTGDLDASVDLLFFSLSWNWGVNIPVFNYERSPTWPSAPGGGSGKTSWPNATLHDGVLTFNGTVSDDNITLTQGPNNALTVGWAGQGSETFPGVLSFVFNGASGDDTLTAAAGLTTPVRAVGGSSNNTFDFRNSSANNTLIAGGGHNTIYGGSGSDMIVGGGGTDMLVAGIGPTILYGGRGTAGVILGSGKDSFYGGSGNYDITGGSGTYFIDGGTGSDIITGGSSARDVIYGGSAGKNQITGGSGGFNTIYGGGADDTIDGGGGHDTIYGSGGRVAGGVTNNVITGGPGGYNLIFGGGGGDFLAGGVGGNNTIYAGTGNESLAGGDGLGLFENPGGEGLNDAAGDALSSGDNTLIGGSGDDTLYGDTNTDGHNLLQAGTGDEVLYAGAGGDTLIAGLGADALYGSIGDDTFQLPFTPAGQTQPPYTLVGGGGTDSLLLKAETGSGSSGLDVTASAIPDATSTEITVSNGLAVAAALPSDGSGLVVQIGVEQMLVKSVSGDVLTVQRGYDGTTAEPHGNNALVLLPQTPDALASPNDYSLYLNQGQAPNEYVATLSTLRFATTTSGSATVTGVDNTAGLTVGQAVSGPGVPAGTTIATIPSSTSITLSSAATWDQSNLPLNFGVVAGTSLTLSGSINNIQLEGGPGNNLIAVDPSVTRDVTIYGGPGQNVLMAGSGNDALIAGPGTAVLYGGIGDDTLYGGDLPTEDVPPNGGDAMVSAHPGAIDGNDTLIAGPGSDELIAGSGNDLLIGGSVVRPIDPVTGVPGVAFLQGSQYQLDPGAGRDILSGGSGMDDILIAGPGSPGEVLEAGSGNDTLIAQNYGVNTLIGGGTGHSLMLGGNLENFEISNSLAGGGNTLVGGLGIDNLKAGAGNDVLYASDDSAAWSQGEAAAAAAGVQVEPPQLFQGDSNAAQLQVLLEAQQSDPLSQSQLNQLIGLLNTEFGALTSQEAGLNDQVEQYLSMPDISQDATVKLQLINLAQQDQFVQIETGVLLGQILNALGAESFQEDSLIGGSGDDTFYGNVQGATWMGGGSANQTFCHYNPSDTVFGNLTGVNTLVLQDEDGDNTITLSQDSSNPNAADFTDNGQTLLVGDFGGISDIQALEIDLGSGRDTVTVNMSKLPSSSGGVTGSLTGLKVVCGTGKDSVDASEFGGSASLVGGAGDDDFKLGAVFGADSQLTGTPTTELDLELGDSLGSNTVTVNQSGLVVNSYTEPLSQLATFGKLLVVGGTGTNTFTTDGLISNVVLEGGSGPKAINNLSATGGTSRLIGGGDGATNTLIANGGTAALTGGSSGTNYFNINGSGTYTIDGQPATPAPTQPSTGVPTPTPSDGSWTTNDPTLTQFRDDVGVATLGEDAIYAGGDQGSEEPSNVIDIYDEVTGTVSRAPVTLTQAEIGVAATAVDGMVLFAGGWNGQEMSDVVDVYQPNSCNAMSHTLQFSRYDMTATTVGDYAIFAGGYTSAFDNGPTEDVDYFDAKTNTWFTHDLSGAGSVAAVTVGNLAMFAGGISNGQPTKIVDIFNSVTGDWSSVTGLSQARSFIAATAVGNLALFYGGLDAAGAETNVVDIYNAATGDWSNTTYGGDRQRIVATTVGERAIFFGGYSGEESDEVDIYDSATGEWSTTTVQHAGVVEATAVGDDAVFGGLDGSGGISNDLQVLSFPTLVTIENPITSDDGTAMIDYSLTGEDGAPNSASVQFQYSVDGGPWQDGQFASVSGGTVSADGLTVTGLTSSPGGTSYSFEWDTATALGGYDYPSVQIRIQPTDSLGVGDPVESASFAVNDASNVNSLAISFHDNSNDIIDLEQNGSTVLFGGSLSGSATNMTSISVFAGTGENLLDAGRMIMPVTLSGGSGTGPDTLIGGASDDTLYFSGVGSTYDGGGGAENTIVFPGGSGDISTLKVSRIDGFLAPADIASSSSDQDILWPMEPAPLANADISSVTLAPGSAAVSLAATFMDPNSNASASTDTAEIN